MPRNPTQPDQVRSQQESPEGLSRKGGMSSDGSTPVSDDPGRRYVERASRELLKDQPDPQVISGDLGRAHMDYDSVNRKYDVEDGSTGEPKPLPERKGKTGPESWNPRSLKTWPE